MNYLISIFLGYFFGSIPSAYLIVKFSHNKNITISGSGNVGALNSYEVTNSKLIGIIVFILDFIKGLIPVLVVNFFIDDQFNLLVNTALFVVLGHCFSIFLKFKGGRGLSTAAGALISIAPSIFVVWGIIWIVSYIYKRHIHFANSAASLLTAILAFTAKKALIKFTFPYAGSNLEFSIYISLIMLIIISKHYQPLKEYFSPVNNSEVKDEQN